MLGNILIGIIQRERKYNNISYLSKLVRSEWSESYWERTWRDEYNSVQPSWMPKPHKEKKPSWKTKGTLLPCERRAKSGEWRAVIWRAVSNEKPIIVKNISNFRNYF